MLDIFRTLPAIMDNLDADDAAREALVFIAWSKIAGEMLAEHTVPLGFENSRLAVAVSGCTWQKHLGDLSPQMIYKLNSEFGSPVVRFIEFSIDEQAVKGDRAKRRKAKAEAEKLREQAATAVPPELALSAEAIADENLRQAFLLAAGSCLVRKERLK